MLDIDLNVAFFYFNVSCQLRHTRGLESLLALHTLDLSFNRIDQTAALSTLVSLKSLDLRSNLIPKLSCLQDFQPVSDNGKRRYWGYRLGLEIGLVKVCLSKDS
jgi:Leucine-rich repeat (LRR) protein